MKQKWRKHPKEDGYYWFRKDPKYPSQLCSLHHYSTGGGFFIRIFGGGTYHESELMESYKKFGFWGLLKIDEPEDW